MKIFTYLTLSFLAANIYCQDFDNLMVKRLIDCSDISYNCGFYYIKYIQEDKIDSAYSLLKYWENKCGMREPIYRAKIILALREGNFHDSLLKDGTINNIFNYQYRMDIIKYSNYYQYEEYESYYGYTPPGQEFDKFTKNEASKLKLQHKPESIEYLLSEFYSDNSDTIFTKIQSDIYKSSILAKQYYKTVESYVKMPEYHISWITGIWIPTGGIKKLGNHPELGMQIGMKKKSMNYDLTMAFKFMNTQNSYYARRTNSIDTLELTNHFFGGHFGCDIGHDIFIRNGHELQVTGGIGIDGFDALESDTIKGLEAASTWTYNLSLGLGYRFYINNRIYIGLRTKYNIVDYSLNNVVDFTGNPITIQLIIGKVDNVYRNSNLKNLRYKFRK